MNVSLIFKKSIRQAKYSHHNDQQHHFKIEEERKFLHEAYRVSDMGFDANELGLLALNDIEEIDAYITKHLS